MALNWVMLNPNRIPVPLPHEMTITTIDSGVEILLTIPTAASTGGGSGGTKRLKAHGKVYLTDQRVCYIKYSTRASNVFLTFLDKFIFISDSPAFESLSVPLHAVLSTRFEQPTFGANFLSFEVKPSSEGGLSDGTHVELRFKERAMFEFVSLLEKSRERAIYMKRQGAEDEEGLRQYHHSIMEYIVLTVPLASYTTPAESSSVTLVGGIPIENPPSYD